MKPGDELKEYVRQQPCKPGPMGSFVLEKPIRVRVFHVLAYWTQEGNLATADIWTTYTIKQWWDKTFWGDWEREPQWAKQSNEWSQYKPWWAVQKYELIDPGSTQ